MNFDLRNERGRRATVAAVAGGAVLSVLAGVGAAHASVQTVDSIGVTGDGRVWDFQNTGGFGISDGTLAVGRYCTDGFDGGLVLYVDGTPFSDSDDLGDYSAGAQTMQVGPESLSSLDVSRVEKAAGPYDRSLVRLRNTTGSAITTTLEWKSDLGSDGSGVINSSSSGSNHAWEKGDRWLVTHAPDDTGYDEDPTLAFVLYGKNAAARPTAILQRPNEGNGWVDLEYTVKVPAGKTRYLLFYTEMWSTPDQAKKSMAKYDKQGLSSKLLSGVSSKVRPLIVNWNL